METESRMGPGTGRRGGIEEVLVKYKLSAIRWINSGDLMESIVTIVNALHTWNLLTE